MIILTPIITPKEVYKSLYSMVRAYCSNYECYKRKGIASATPSMIYTQLSNLIQVYTHDNIPSCYDTSFAKQLRRYFYSYRHQRIERVSLC